MNGNGDIFGGWVLSQMDMAGGALAARVAKGRVATVAITAMTFVEPIKVGDMVSIYGEVTQGRPDVDHHRARNRRAASPRNTDIRVTHGTFVFVAIDEDGKPRAAAAGGHGMRRLFALALIVAAMLAPGVALAHPHIWIQQVVRVVAKDGKYTHVEIEWRFDPFSSEIEIPLIDEDKDGKFSAQRDQSCSPTT